MHPCLCRREPHQCKPTNVSSCLGNVTRAAGSSRPERSCRKADWSHISWVPLFCFLHTSVRALTGTADQPRPHNLASVASVASVVHGDNPVLRTGRCARFSSELQQPWECRAMSQSQPVPSGSTGYSLAHLPASTKQLCLPRPSWCLPNGRIHTPRPVLCWAFPHLL